MDVSIAFRVTYVVRDPWHLDHKHKVFDTRQAAEDFRAPLVVAARKMGQFHDMPTIDEVGIVAAQDGVRFSRGPSVDVEIAAHSPS